MKKNNILYRIIIFAVITVVILFFNFKAKSDLSNGSDLQITKWNNYYSGNDIHFYYLDPKNENLSKLKIKYGLSKLIDAKADQFDNSIKIMKYINQNVEAKSTAMTSNKNAIDIMKVAFDGSKISDSDYTTILSECLTSVGINVRRGVLQCTDKKVKGKSYFNVCEIWSVKYNKWIMIDGVNGCYMREKGVPLAATQIIDKGIDKIQIVNLKDTGKYIKKMFSYYESYSISVDNNKYGDLKSNSKITYLKGKQLPKMETKEGFIESTIFVNKPNVFQISPMVKYINKGKEKTPTLIFAKGNLKSDTKKVENYTVGVFMNSYMIKDYFISINGAGYIKVDTFYNLQIVKGTNTIKLSKNGKILTREVVIEK